MKKSGSTHILEIQQDSGRSPRLHSGSLAPLYHVIDCVYYHFVFIQKRTSPTDTRVCARVFADRKALAERVETETSCLDESSESCDTDVSCDMEKATTTADLGRDAEGGQFRPAQTFQGPENSSDANGHCVLPSEGRPVPDGQARRTEPPVSKDPFDNLVSIAKADLKKSGGGGKKTPVENAESGKVSVQGETPCVNGNAPSRELDAEGVARYNDDVPWAERTRAGRVKNVAD